MGFLHAIDAFGDLLTFRTPLFCAVGYWRVLVSIQANAGTTPHPRVQSCSITSRRFKARQQQACVCVFARNHMSWEQLR